MANAISWLFDTTPFPPRWSCGNAWGQEQLTGWTHIVSDLGTFAAYTAIPIVLAYFVLRRKDVVFPRIFWLFCVFIFACGTVHLIEAAIFWWPVYRLSALVKFVTVVASLATVVAMIRIAPAAMRLPGLAQLAKKLEQENLQRKAAEERLSHMNDNLEQVIEKRSRELELRADELARVNDELERFNRMALGREQRIIELKREVNQLLEESGGNRRYELEIVEPSQE